MKSEKKKKSDRPMKSKKKKMNSCPSYCEVGYTSKVQYYYKTIQRFPRTPGSGRFPFPLSFKIAAVVIFTCMHVRYEETETYQLISLRALSL